MNGISNARNGKDRKEKFQPRNTTLNSSYVLPSILRSNVDLPRRSPKWRTAPPGRPKSRRSIETVRWSPRQGKSYERSRFLDKIEHDPSLARSASSSYQFRANEISDRDFARRPVTASNRGDAIYDQRERVELLAAKGQRTPTFEQRVSFLSIEQFFPSPFIPG